jgi:hypothetical protein
MGHHKIASGADQPTFMKDRSVARTSSLACVLLGLCLSRPAPSGEPREALRRTIGELPALQRADGGWS